MAIKNGLIFSNTAEDTFFSSGSSMSDGIVTIPKILHFKIPDTDNPRDYSDIDVYSHRNFPQYGSALPEDARYKFYGNASIEKQPDSHYFHATCQYSTSDANATDSDGGGVTSDTPPWKLKPDNIVFSYPETNIPFRAAYNNKGRLWKAGTQNTNNPIALIPVTNTAGDPIDELKPVKNINISFTYAIKNFNPNQFFIYPNSVNKNEIKILGITIPAQTATITSLEPNYITVYEDNSNKAKWEYWSININILVDIQDTVINAHPLNIGDRALFDAFTFTPTNTEIAATENAETIVSWIMPTKDSKGKYIQLNGKKMYSGWQQFVKCYQLLNNSENDYFQMQYEQMEKMPLLPNGHLDVDAITIGHERFKSYYYLTFRRFPFISWESLNLPKKGIQW